MLCLQLKMSDLESELDKREAEANAVSSVPASYSEGLPSAFGTTTIKHDPSYLAHTQAPGSQPFSTGLTMSMVSAANEGRRFLTNELSV